MIPARMNRPIRLLLTTCAAVAIVVGAAACGTQKISVPKSAAAYDGAVIFSQRCSGCHSLDYAGTHGSASNVRSREITNGPNFNVRCERPITRVLYAIENGGFSGAIMPQNIVVGEDAQKVAQFVATYAGREATKTLGATPCINQPVGTLPSPTATTAAATTPTTTTTPTPTTKAAKTKAGRGAKHKKKK
jgi:mono/diheme cytochrome c family protein